MDDLPTLRAEGWLECGRILQFLVVVLVGAVPDVHLGFEGFAAFVAVFPEACMSFIVMGPAEGIAIVVSAAAVPRIRERDILVMIVAYPILTSVGPFVSNPNRRKRQSRRSFSGLPNSETGWSWN
jgi:hypothetical protein